MDTCFIIMPITTPPHMVDVYGDDQSHFEHVLQCLFVPAVEKAGLEPIPPKSEGAELIHGEIVANLETSTLVLCDISCLNPNVFFELGCRTALNKPVTYVMDEQTPHIPFDTGIINHFTYQSSLKPWQLPQQIDTLADHITTSLQKSCGKNSLWQYFGLSSTAKPTETPGDEDKLDYLMMQMDSLRRALEARAASADVPTSTYERPTAWRESDQRFIETVEQDYERVRELLRNAPDREGRAQLRWLIELHLEGLTRVIDETDSKDLGLRARRLRHRLRQLLYTDRTEAKPEP